MLVAIYARHSTDKQNGSASDQIQRCHEYCRQRGYSVIQAYADEALSGASLTNRPGLNALITAAVDGDFDRIITEDLSRISRDQGDVATFFKKMSFLDVSIETVAEGHIGELHIGLKGTMNALYLKDLADKTRRGQIAAVLKGSIPGGTCYGYSIVRRVDERGEPIRGAREINDEEAEIVRQIFRDYHAGRTLKRICEDLNAQGIPSPANGAWVPSTLIGSAARQTGMLRNTLYKGVITFNKMRFRKHPETGKRLSVMRPEREWVKVPVPELAVVDDKLFDEVQEMIVERSSNRRALIEARKVEDEKERAEREAARQRRWRQQQAKPAMRPRFVFSGRLHCVRHDRKIDTRRTRIYGCRETGCRDHTIRHDEITTLCLEALAALSVDDVRAYYDSAPVVAQRREHEAAIERLAPLIEERRAAVRHLLQSLGSTARTESVRGYLNEQEQEIRRLRMEQIKEERRRDALQPSKTEMAAAVTAFHRRLTRLRVAPEDNRLATPLRRCADRFEVFGTYDTDGGTYRRRVRAVFNIPEIMDLARER
jgi:DNA invertase Pin-like site-specific DNA recombinase